MSYVIRIYDDLVPEGAWLTEYDPDGGDPDLDYPTGTIVTSNERKLALKFDTFEMAVACRHMVSTRTPVRPDGLPNRPLTALTCAIEPYEVVRDGWPERSPVDSV